METFTIHIIEEADEIHPILTSFLSENENGLDAVEQVTIVGRFENCTPSIKLPLEDIIEGTEHEVTVYKHAGLGLVLVWDRDYRETVESIKTCINEYRRVHQHCHKPLT